MKTFITLFIAACISNAAFTQGCITVRNIFGFGQYNLTDKAFTTSEWRLNITNRYFKAFHDFKGNEDQKPQSRINR